MSPVNFTKHCNNLFTFQIKRNKCVKMSKTLLELLHHAASEHRQSQKYLQWKFICLQKRFTAYFKKITYFFMGRTTVGTLKGAHNTLLRNPSCVRMYDDVLSCLE